MNKKNIKDVVVLVAVGAATVIPQVRGPLLIASAAYGAMVGMGSLIVGGAAAASEAIKNIYGASKNG